MKNLLILLGLTYCGASFGQSEQDIFNETAILCVSTLGVASMLTETELSKMIFERDAKWWRQVLAVSVERTEADRRVMASMKDLNARWSSDQISWDQLLDLAKKCSEMKIMLESSSE